MAEEQQLQHIPAQGTPWLRAPHHCGVPDYARAMLHSAREAARGGGPRALPPANLFPTATQQALGEVPEPPHWKHTQM